MKPLMSPVFLSLALLGSSSVASAHQIWIEQEGKNAKVYLGEYGGNLKELSPGLLGDMPIPEGVSQTDKAQNKLDITREKDHFNLKGKFDDKSSLLVQVNNYPVYQDDDGKGNKVPKKWVVAARSTHDFAPQTPKTTLDIVPAGPNKIALYFKDKVKPNAELSLISPNGWMKKIWTDDKGEATVEPLWKGWYVVEIGADDPLPGELDGKKYTAVNYTTTLSFYNKKGPVTQRPAPAQPEPPH